MRQSVGFPFTLNSPKNFDMASKGDEYCRAKIGIKRYKITENRCKTSALKLINKVLNFEIATFLLKNCITM